MDAIFKVDAVTGFRRLFYGVTPNETSFETLQDVPSYVDEAGPFFILAVIIEGILLRFYKRREATFPDGVTSISVGQFFLLANIKLKLLQTLVYVLIYDNVRLVDLPWDSPWTWAASFLGVDFFFYWQHRMGHEINILWATHQVHHSSEEFNFSTALRQPLLETSYAWIFNLPLALAIPPSHMLVHIQLNLIYQFWIHTELISNLGPLEYILNTPSHHRVHHGRNRYCIDKNYAGVLIIWDRMFGTFAQEKENVAFGIVHRVETYNPISLQMFCFQGIWERLWSTSGLMNKLCVIFYGPGWEPGKPRTGLLEDIPDVKGPVLDKYRNTIPGWLRNYIMLHFVLGLVISQVFMDEYDNGLSSVHASMGMVFLIYTFTSIGCLCDMRPWWTFHAEIARCALVIMMTAITIHDDVITDVGSKIFLYFLLATFGLSFLILVSKFQHLRQESIKEKHS